MAFAPDLVDGIQKGDMVAVKKIIEEKPQLLNAPLTSDNNTPLIIAAQKGRAEMVEYLALQGANTNGVNMYHETAAHIAAREGRTEVIGVLARAGANLDAVNKDGWTPLIFAAQERRPESMKALIENDANVDAIDKHGRTAAHWTAIKNFDVGAKILVAAAADTTILDDGDRTPGKVAVEYGNVAVAATLSDNTIVNNLGKWRSRDNDNTPGAPSLSPR